MTGIAPEWRPLALYLLTVARQEADPTRGGNAAMVKAVTDAPGPAWRAAQVAAWLVRVLAGRFDNSPSDRTDDPRTADHIIKQARAVVELESGTVYAAQAVHLAALAFEPEAAEAAALRWHREHDETDFYSWVVTDAAINLLRALSDMAMFYPDSALSRDRALDVLSAELLEHDLVSHTKGDNDHG